MIFLPEIRLKRIADALLQYLKVDLTQNINNNTEIKDKIKQSKKDLTPIEDLTDELQSKELEIEYQDNKIKQLINENNKLRNEKINNISNLSDDDMVKFITEWAKRNGHLPK